MKIVLNIILSIIVGAIGFGGGFLINTEIVNKPQTEVYVNGNLAVHFLELGNNHTGDSVYIKCGDYDILIDAGSKYDSSSTIIKYVDQFVVDNTLEYVIATHAHEDHIAGFSSKDGRQGIFKHYKVENIIDFPKTNSTSAVYNNYVKERDGEIEEGANHWTALECYNNENGGQRIIQLAQDIELEILYNYYYDHNSNDENEYSVCVMINYGDYHYLFTGDLEGDGESRLVDYYEANHGGLPHCILYKAGHHGSKTSSSEKLLKAITPEYVCVCCCAGTKEYTTTPANQFPTQKFIDNISVYTDKVYVTTVVDDYEKSTVKPMNGNIVVSWKSGELEINCTNNNIILKDTDWFKKNRTCPLAWAV